jgi:hypothetical protein
VFFVAEEAGNEQHSAAPRSIEVTEPDMAIAPAAPLIAIRNGQAEPVLAIGWYSGAQLGDFSLLVLDRDEAGLAWIPASEHAMRLAAVAPVAHEQPTAFRAPRSTPRAEPR